MGGRGKTIRYGVGRQERSPEDQQNEWKYATSGRWEVGGFLESIRDLEGKRLRTQREGLEMKCPTVQGGNSQSPPPEERQGIKWRDGFTIPLSKIMNQNCSWLKELRGQKWRRDCGKGSPVTGPTWDSS